MRAAGVSSFTQLTVNDDSGNALISYSGQSITLTGIIHSNVTAGNFIFSANDVQEDSFEFEQAEMLFGAPITPIIVADDLFEPENHLQSIYDFETRNISESLKASEDIVLASIEAFGLSSLTDVRNIFDTDEFGLWDLF